MTFRINHIHIKSPEPEKAAEWWVKAFNCKIISDETRVFGDRFIRCQTEDGGMVLAISDPRTGETLAPADAAPRFGLEHFGIETADIEADIARLEKLGARLVEGPSQVPNGPRFAFLRAPGDVRVELVQPPK
jgi:catechol 2,3-dioxygenase-like lactoylglutathione lyase family enzyme